MFFSFLGTLGIHLGSKESQMVYSKDHEDFEKALPLCNKACELRNSDDAARRQHRSQRSRACGRTCIHLALSFSQRHGPMKKGDELFSWLENWTGGCPGETMVHNDPANRFLDFSNSNYQPQKLQGRISGCLKAFGKR